MSVYFVNVQRVLDESRAGTVAAKALKLSFEAAQKEHAKLEVELQKKPKAKEEIAEKMRLLQIKTEKDLEQQRKREQQSVLKKMRPHLTAVAKEKGATSILDTALALHVEPSHDLTTDVLSRMGA